MYIEYPVQPVDLYFGDPGQLIIDATEGRVAVQRQAVTPEFVDFEDFVGYLHTTFNAIPTYDAGKIVGFELQVTVLGEPLSFDGTEFQASRAPLQELIAGPQGRIILDEKDVCLDPSLCGVLNEATGLVPPPGYTGYWTEGRLYTSRENFEGPTPRGFNLTFINAVTIEHDGIPDLTSVWDCELADSIAGKCVVQRARDNYLYHELSWRRHGLDRSADYEAVNVRAFSSAIWEGSLFDTHMGGTVEGYHTTTNGYHAGEDQTSLP